MDRLLISSNKSLENDLLRICRLCGMDNPNKIPILDELFQFMNKEDPNDPGIRTKILVCVGIAICRDDGMPHNICTLCSDKICDFYEFREMCMETEKQLKHLLGLLKGESTETKKNPRKRAKDISNLAASINLALGTTTTTTTTKKDDINKMDEDDNIESILGDFGSNVGLKNGTKKNGGKRGQESINSTATLPKKRGTPKNSRKKPLNNNLLLLDTHAREDVTTKVDGDNKPMVIIPSINQTSFPQTTTATAIKRRRSKGAKNNDLLKQKIPNERELLAECLDPKSKKRLSKKMKLMAAAATKEIPATITSSPVTHGIGNSEVIELCDSDDDNININRITNILPQLKKEILMEAVPLPQYKCNICGLYFTTQSNYVEHLTVYHLPWTSRFGCSSCCELFKSESELIEHECWHKKRSHKYTCIVCDKKFERFTAFNNHVANCREHKMVPFVDDILCTTCNQYFKTVNLYHFHPCAVRKARTFCVGCQRGFSGNSPYSRHLKRCIYRNPLPPPPPPTPTPPPSLLAPEPSSPPPPSNELIQSTSCADDVDIKNVLTDMETTEISVDTTDIVNSILNCNDTVKIEPSIEIDNNNDVAVTTSTSSSSSSTKELNIEKTVSIKEEPIDVNALQNTIIKIEKNPDIPIPLPSSIIENRKEKKIKRKRKKRLISDKNKNQNTQPLLIVNVKQEPLDANERNSIDQSMSMESSAPQTQGLQAEEAEAEEEEEGEEEEEAADEDELEQDSTPTEPLSNEASPPIRIKQEIMHPGYADYNPNIVIKSEPGLFSSPNEQNANQSTSELTSPNKQPPILLKFTKRNGRMVSSKVVPNEVPPNDVENQINESNDQNEIDNNDDNYGGADDHQNFMDSNDESEAEDNVENRQNNVQQDNDSNSLPAASSTTTTTTTTTTTEKLSSDITLPVITEIISGDGQSTKINNNNNDNNINPVVSSTRISRNGKKKNRPKLLQNPFAIAAAKRIKTERITPERELLFSHNENIHDLYAMNNAEMPTLDYDNMNFNAGMFHHQTDIVIKPDPDELPPPPQQQQIVIINGQSQIIKTEKISDEYPPMYENHNDNDGDDETLQSIENPPVNVNVFMNTDEYNTIEQSLHDNTSKNNYELDQSKSSSAPASSSSSSTSSLSTENAPINSETPSTMKSLKISIPQEEEEEEEEKESSSSPDINITNITDAKNTEKNNVSVTSILDDSSKPKTNQNDEIKKIESITNEIASSNDKIVLKSNDTVIDEHPSLLISPLKNTNINSTESSPPKVMTMEKEKQSETVEKTEEDSSSSSSEDEENQEGKESKKIKRPLKNTNINSTESSPPKVMTMEKEKQSETVEKTEEDSSSSSSEDEENQEGKESKKIKRDKKNCKLKIKESRTDVANSTKHSTVEGSPSVMVSQSITNQSLPPTDRYPAAPNPMSSHQSQTDVQQKSPSSSNLQQQSQSPYAQQQQHQLLPPSPQKPSSSYTGRIPSPIQSSSPAQYPSISSSIGSVPSQQQQQPQQSQSQQQVSPRQQYPKQPSPYMAVVVASPKPSPELMSPPNSPLNQMLLNQQITPKRNQTAFASNPSNPKGASYIMLSPSRPQRQDSPYTSSPQRSPYPMSPSQNIQSSPSNTILQQLSPSQYGTSPQQQQRSSCYYDQQQQQQQQQQRSPMSSSSSTNLLQIQSTLNNSDYPSSSSSSSQQQQQQQQQRPSCQYANQQSPQQSLIMQNVNTSHYHQSPNSRNSQQNLFNTKSTAPSPSSQQQQQQHSPYGNNLYSTGHDSSSILSGNLQQPSSCMMMNENRSSHLNNPVIGGGAFTNIDQSMHSSASSSSSSSSQCGNNPVTGYHHLSPNHTISPTSHSHLNTSQSSSSSCLISPNHQQQQQQSPHHQHHHQNMLSQQSLTNPIINDPLTISTNSIQFNQNNFIDFIDTTTNFRNNQQFNDFNNSDQSTSTLLSTVSNNITSSSTSSSSSSSSAMQSTIKMHQKLEDELEDIIKSITTSTADKTVTETIRSTPSIILTNPPPPSSSSSSATTTTSSSSSTSSTSTTTHLYESIENEFQTDRLLSELTAAATGQQSVDSYLFDDVDATDVDLDLDSALLDDHDDDDDGDNNNINGGGAANHNNNNNNINNENI